MKAENDGGNCASAKLTSGECRKVIGPPTGSTPISEDPADHDGRRPYCHSCTDNFATVRTVVGGHAFCQECYEDWLNGRFDQDDPQELKSEG